MKTKFYRSASFMVALAVALSVIPNALGQCGLPTKRMKPTNWRNSQSAGAHLLGVALHRPDDDDDEGSSIVGMWHVVFTAQTQDGAPANFVLDDAIAVWHKDGTEIMNSSRPAQDGNFCLGVWEKTGKLKYHLNHIPWAGNDTMYAPSGIGNPQAGVQLIEHVILSRDGNSYFGKFILQAYDSKKQLSVTFTGMLTATRITPNTPITDLF